MHFISDAKFEIAHLKRQKRHKRSLQDTQDLNALKSHLNINLSPRNSFLDPQFLLLKRWSNGTELVLDQHSDEEIDMCYYKSDSAALYACDDVVCKTLRGFFFKFRFTLYPRHQSKWRAERYGLLIRDVETKRLGLLIS